MSNKFYELYCEEVTKNEKPTNEIKELKSSKVEKIDNKMKHLKIENQHLKSRVDYLEEKMDEVIERAISKAMSTG